MRVLDSYMTPPWNVLDVARLTVCLQSTSQDVRYFTLKRKNVYGYTVFHYAAYWGHTDIINCLVNFVSDEQISKLLLIQNYLDNTALHCAASLGHTETIKSVLGYLSEEERFELLRKQNHNGDTSIHCAAFFGHLPAIQQMLNFLPPGKQIEILEVQNIDKKTAFELAVEEDQTVTAGHMEECKISAEWTVAEQDDCGKFFGNLGFLSLFY